MSHNHLCLSSVILTVSGTVLIICLMLTGLTSCSSTAGQRSLWSQDHTPLPPTGLTYTVIGHVDGIKHFVIAYDDAVLRGGRILSDAGATFLTNRGVSTVIAVHPSETEALLLYEYNINLLEFPADRNEPIPPDVVADFINVVSKSEKPVYLRSEEGTHIAGAFGMAYRIHACHWPYQDALIEFGRLGGSLKDDHTMTESLRSGDK